MDDIRFIWLRDKVFNALDINEPDVFDEFMLRDDGDNELKIAKFLNQTEEDEDFALIFNKEIREEESVSNQVFFTVIVLKPRYLPTIEAWIAKMPDNNDIIH